MASRIMPEATPEARQRFALPAPRHQRAGRAAPLRELFSARLGNDPAPLSRYGGAEGLRPRFMIFRLSE